MKILHVNRKKGVVKILTESLNDLWVLYNVVQPGDRIEGKTLRRVVLRDGDKGERKSMYLGLHVEDLAFHESSNRLRVKGRIYAGPDDLVSMGKYHTMNVEPHQKYTFLKEEWLDYQLDRLRAAARPVAETRMLVVAIEKGEAVLGLVSNYSLSPTTTIHENIPGKRYKKFAKDAVSNAWSAFYEGVEMAANEVVSREPVDLVIVAGPGFIKDDFAERLRKRFPDWAAKVRLAQASSASDSAIQEVLRQDAVVEMAKDQRVVVETRLMDEFVRRLGKEEGTIAYGLKEIQTATEMGAVEKLLIADRRFRDATEAKRRALDHLLKTVEMGGGTIYIVSSMHPAGEQLMDFGGIVALLRFRIS